MSTIRNVVVLAILIPVLIAFCSAPVLIDRYRGYQVITLKTRMYWDNGKAVAGEKIKTWQIAIPPKMNIVGNYEALNSLATQPIYSDRRQDFGTSRFVSTKSVLTVSGDIIPYNPSLGGIKEFALSFTNEIPLTNIYQSDGIVPTIYYRASDQRADCISHEGNVVDYHGWLLRHSPAYLTSAEICAVLVANLDRWTLHIDDLLSKDSGDQQ